MMTQFRNSLTWRDIVKYGVEMYGFIIRGKGKMSGSDFVNHICKVYECSDERSKIIITEIEKHVVHINVTYRGTEYWTT